MHPMYRRPEDSVMLSQGDLINSKLLIETGALDGHQDYMKTRQHDFRLFCVMTQTCDLVPDRCSEYITLSVVRLLRHVFDKSTSLKNSDERQRTKQVLARIIEHQQNSRDFFYLHPEPGKIEEDSVIDLRVMFSLNSAFHYKQIVQSRCISMNELYAANLGWMAGNVFARIAMPPWEKLHPKETKKTRINSLLQIIEEKGHITRDRPAKRS